MLTDPLSDMLDLLRSRAGFSGRLIAGGTWGDPMILKDAVAFCAATKGSCWYFMEGMEKPQRFVAGDVLVVNFRQILVLASDPVMATKAVPQYPSPDAYGNYRYGEGEDFCMLSGSVEVDADHQALLQTGLPPLIHVRGTAPEAAPLASLIEQLLEEMKPEPEPGRKAMISALAELLFARTLRAYLVSASNDDAGWLKVFSDSQLAAVLSCIHNDPAHDWTLKELAKTARMSRTTFTDRFRKAMGMPPLQYVSSWRLRLAKRELRAGAYVSQVADKLGYATASAFSAAFKRSIGISPKEYREAAKSQSAE